MHMLIQIPRWLIKPMIWRFVCFSSSIAGLLCYALSSSFNHLFGKWSWWKTFLYICFSLIISVATLFAKAWQRSNSLRVKAHMAFLVLIITCVYSFFFDKVVRGKPDAYSLISCAAFAIMSLSLSRQSHCGFEIDLLYFFSGGLTVQLMKIKLWLVIVGASFCYSLIILRTSLDSPPDSAHLSLQVQDQVVIEVNTDSEETNIGSAIQVDPTHASFGTTTSIPDLIMPQEVNASSVLRVVAVDAPSENADLRVQEQKTSQDKQGNHSDIDRIMSQLMASIKALKKKNRKVIRMVSKHVEEYLQVIVESKTSTGFFTDPVRLHLRTDMNLVMDALPSGIINDLHEVVKLMLAAGFEKECCHVYINWRREFLQECLWRYGLQELHNEDINLMQKIESWTKALTIAVRILFHNERRLCDRIFLGYSDAADISFRDVCKEVVIHLLSIADSFVYGCQSPDLLCSMIPKVDETLCDLLPQFESLFSNQFGLSIKNEFHKFWKRLGEAIRGIFNELENLISRDMEQAAAPGGELCPIISKVMICLINVSKASDITLSEAFEKYSRAPNREGESSFSMETTRMIELLERNMEAKSKNYTNPTFGYVFMMNNLRYLEFTAMNNLRYFETSAKNSPLQGLLGKDWIQKQTAKVQQYYEFYQTSSWNKVFDLLKLENNDSVVPNVSAESMKDKLKLFNQHFEEMCYVQSSWSVFGEELRKQIITSLEKVLLPAYGNFIGKFQDCLGNHAYEYIKYGMLDIQHRLNHLFLIR